MKIARKLVDDTEQVLGKTKLLGIKREQNPHKGQNRRASFFCNFITPTIITPFIHEAVFWQMYLQQ